jgi:hypothetical protein
MAREAAEPEEEEEEEEAPKAGGLFGGLFGGGKKKVEEKAPEVEEKVEEEDDTKPMVGSLARARHDSHANPLPIYATVWANRAKSMFSPVLQFSPVYSLMPSNFHPLCFATGWSFSGLPRLLSKVKFYGKVAHATQSPHQFVI